MPRPIGNGQIRIQFGGANLAVLICYPILAVIGPTDLYDIYVANLYRPKGSRLIRHLCSQNYMISEHIGHI